MKTLSALMGAATARREAMAGVVAAAMPATNDLSIGALRRELQAAAAEWNDRREAAEAAIERAFAAVPDGLSEFQRRVHLARARAAERCAEMQAAEDAAHAKIWPLLERLLAVQPVTMAGYAAKNAALLAAFVDPEDDAREPRDVLVRAMLAEAVRMSGVQS